jgi:hypothetical protein
MDHACDDKKQDCLLICMNRLQSDWQQRMCAFLSTLREFGPAEVAYDTTRRILAKPIMLAIRILLHQMCNRSDLNQKFRPHQIGANAVSGRRILAKVLPINFVHCGVPAHIGKKNLVERDVLQ